MRLREGLSILVLAAAVAACSGSSPTTGPTTGGDGNGSTPAPQQPTDEPEPTADPGNGNGNGNGNGGPDFGQGKVTFTVSGPIETSGEYAFIAPASIFGGANGSSLSFSDNLEENASLFNILIGQDGAVLVSWAGPEGQVPAANCTTSNWNVGATSGSGSFDCTAEFSMMPSGAVVAGGKITGTFEAHA